MEQLYPVPDQKQTGHAGALPERQRRPVGAGGAGQPGCAGRSTACPLPELSPERLAGIKRVSRRRMAAPAAGSGKVHEVEQAQLIETALGE